MAQLEQKLHVLMLLQGSTTLEKMSSLEEHVRLHYEESTGLEVEYTAVNEIVKRINMLLNCYAVLLKTREMDAKTATWKITGGQGPVALSKFSGVTLATMTCINAEKAMPYQRLPGNFVKDAINVDENSVVYISSALNSILGELCEASINASGGRSITKDAVIKGIELDPELKRMFACAEMCTPTLSEEMPPSSSYSKKTCQVEKADGRRCSNVAKFRDRLDGKVKCGLHCKASNRKEL